MRAYKPPSPRRTPPHARQCGDTPRPPGAYLSSNTTHIATTHLDNLNPPSIRRRRLRTTATHGHRFLDHRDFRQLHLLVAPTPPWTSTRRATSIQSIASTSRRIPTSSMPPKAGMEAPLRPPFVIWIIIWTRAQRATCTRTPRSPHIYSHTMETATCTKRTCSKITTATPEAPSPRPPHPRKTLPPASPHSRPPRTGKCTKPTCHKTVNCPTAR